MHNSFTNRSKVEEQRREIHAFKEENWPEIVAIELVVGVIPLGGFEAPELAVNFALNLLQKAPRSRLIVVTIKRRSVHDREVIEPRSWPILFLSSVGIVFRDRCLESMTKNPGSRLDHAAIVVRYDRDRGVLPRILPAV